MRPRPGSASQFQLAGGAPARAPNHVEHDEAGGSPEELGRARGSFSSLTPNQAPQLLQEIEPSSASDDPYENPSPEEMEERVLRRGEGNLPAASTSGEITRLLHRVRAGDAEARNELFRRAYGELTKLAHARLYHAGRSNALDTSALVAEVYLRFVRSSDLRSEDRRSFFAFASRVMRNVIVDTVRARLVERRGGGARELTLSTELLDQLSSGEEVILEVHEALLMLEQVDPRLAQVVEMRYFCGYTEDEIARELGVTARTVQRDWTKARLLLRVALQRKS